MMSVSTGLIAAAILTALAPYEADEWPVPATPLDVLVAAAWEAQGVTPAQPCSDDVFMRRVFVDLTGTLPHALEVEAFRNNGQPDKRAALIDALMARAEFADYWALKWGDILRVKAEFPINLWPNAVQAYHRWLYESVRDNKPYDVFARELLTSSGSNFRVPPVNFYRAVQGREPSIIAAAAALTFMGVRFDTWPEETRKGMEAFFSRIAYKATGEWKEEIVGLNPAPAPAVDAVFPDGSTARIAPGQDPRLAFADWLIRPENPWFARAAVNRVWAWLFGRGIIHEPDDLRPDNPPSNPALLAYLEKELVASKYDLRHIYRLILNSRTYQQSSIPQSSSPEAESLFAYYPVRRMDAEVLIDALCDLCGDGESYMSMAPEPYTYIPEELRTIELSDGSITSAFLEMFGRPARDTGLESERNNQPTDAQRLHMLNSTHVQNKIEKSSRLDRLIKQTRGRTPAIIRGLYLSILSRPPAEEEQKAAAAYFQTKEMTPRQAATDVAWALINTKEFLYRH